MNNRTKRPMQITWKDIVITAQPPSGKCKPKNAIKVPKEIIRGVSGTVMPGQFVAIIGASGAGKTTMLNYLSGREISQNLDKSGTITINGQPTSQIRNFSSLSAYVQQDDILFQTMTVRECLEFAAKLKLPGDLESKLARVRQLIYDLKLVKCSQTRIGGPLVKGVSGGERKRTSIGVELITDPSLIFLDEPTTGLDSFTATSVMEILGDLARKENRTVISTIHQPNSDIFEMFDQLMLLARGKIIYFNKAELAVNYFGGIGFQCPELSNPADYFMTMMSIESIELDNQNETGAAALDKDAIEERYSEQIAHFVKSYEESNLVNDHSAIHPDIIELDMGAPGQGQGPTTSFFYQFGLLCARNFLNLLRLPQTSYVKLLTTCVTALFAILLFFNVGTNEAGIQNIQGSLFFICMNIAFNAIQNVILIFPDERPVFLREVNNNMYSVSPYFWAKIISELPFSILTPTIFGSIVYYAIGLNDMKIEYFGIFILILILCYNASSGYSLIISASFSDKQLAVTLTPVLIIPFMLFAGFFVSTDNIPIFLKEFEYISIFKYGYNALLINQFEPYMNQTDPAFGCIKAGTCEPLSQISDKDGNHPSMWGCIGALAAIYVVCYMISWIILACLSKRGD